MTGPIFTSYVRNLTFTNAQTLPDAKLLEYANIEQADLAELITNEVSEDYFQLSFERDLVAGQREYALMKQLMLHVKRISAKLDGEKWELLNELDMNKLREPLVTEENIQFAMAGKKPVYDPIDIGIKIYSEKPIINVTKGIHVDAIIYPENITEANLASEYDLSRASSPVTTRLPKPTHKVWAIRTSIAYKQARPKPIPLNQTEQNLQSLTDQMLNNLRGRNLDRSFVPNTPVDTGLNY